VAETEVAARTILKSRYLVALTGAGVSVESGIPPFRGPDGLWTRFGEPDMRDYERFKADPKGWWDRRLKHTQEPMGLGRSIRGAEPNLGHYAFAKLEQIGVLKALITQNIDNLHNVAGSRNVVEIHGNAYKLRCTTCHNRYEAEGFQVKEIPPRCPECGGVMKEDTVMFGEPIPSDVLRRCYEETHKCDCMLVIGTSGIVYPAAALPISVKQGGGILIEVNPRETELTVLCDITLRAPSGEVLPKLVEEIKRMREGQ